VPPLRRTLERQTGWIARRSGLPRPATKSGEAAPTARSTVWPYHPCDRKTTPAAQMPASR
jgi:hypothetical protein